MAQDFTPTERRILDMLSDGMRHKKEELHACLANGDSAVEAVSVHVWRIKQKLQPKGHDIVCVLSRGAVYYQHVITLPRAGDGKH